MFVIKTNGEFMELASSNYYPRENKVAGTVTPEEAMTPFYDTRWVVLLVCYRDISIPPAPPPVVISTSPPPPAGTPEPALSPLAIVLLVTIPVITILATVISMLVCRGRKPVHASPYQYHHPGMHSSFSMDHHAHYHHHHPPPAAPVHVFPAVYYRGSSASPAAAAAAYGSNAAAGLPVRVGNASSVQRGTVVVNNQQQQQHHQQAVHQPQQGASSASTVLAWPTVQKSSAPQQKGAGQPAETVLAWPSVPPTAPEMPPMAVQQQQQRPRPGSVGGFINNYKGNLNNQAQLQDTNQRQQQQIHRPSSSSPMAVVVPSPTASMDPLFVNAGSFLASDGGRARTGNHIRASSPSAGRLSQFGYHREKDL